MSVYLTYFVHSVTTDNEAGIATGWQPGELSAEGIRRARKAADAIKEKRYHFDAIMSSDLARATVSARLLFGKGYKNMTDARLREADYGDFTGRPARSFKQNIQQYIEAPFPNGESYRDVESRMEDFLYDLKRDYAGQKVAIVGHQATQLALEVLLRGKTWPQAFADDWRKTGAWQAGWYYILE